ncbi:MAG: mechanosensitive ion channel family protein [Bacteroidia bacterium]|nr:mechanosensitive ion channel family protein [Bacteroidia bacterium]MDW8301955.1 mechanosensitive ion channel family protein [Bacteroidia bacterium]
MKEFFGFFQQTYWGNTVGNYILIGIILSVSIFLRKKIATFIKKLFETYLVKKGYEIDDEKVDSITRRPIYYFIFFLGLWLCYHFYQVPKEWQAGGEWLTNAKGEKIYKPYIGFFEILGYVIKTLFVISIARMLSAIANAIAFIISMHVKKTQSRTDDQIVPLLYQVTKVLIYTFTIIFLLGNVFHLNVSNILTGVGIGGIAIALGAQETIGNFISSLVIVFDKPFQVGDFIKYGANEGFVEQIGFRSTKIRGLDRTLYVVPNRALTGVEVVNFSKRTHRRGFYTLRLQYDTTPAQIKAIKTQVLEMLKQDERLDPEMYVHLHDFGQFGFEMQIIYYLTNIDYLHGTTTHEDILLKITDIVLKNGAKFAVARM